MRKFKGDKIIPHNDEIYLMGFVFFILAISVFGIIWMSCELLIIKYILT